ncbi:MAG: peptidyl-prolyl cis-trans isomerase [Thermodesulfovibrionales bacterium]|nr:peptidyl-prolyl cis-trans isomerase [Thermodesulfovibrionales bacterium]
MKIILALICTILIFTSCSKDSKSGYVAKIDGVVITKEDVNEQMKMLPDMAKQFFEGPDGYSRFVDELVKKELLYLEAVKRGMDKDKEFQKKLEEFKKITLINNLLDKELEITPTVTDEDIKNYYEKNKEDFIINKQLRVSHIFVKNQEDLNRVKERLDKGEDFAKVASEMSADKASGKAGGDIGFLKKGELSPEIERIIFTLKKGQVSSPIKVNDGYRLIKVTDIKGTQLEFEKVKGLINQRLIAEKQKESFDNFIEKTKKNYKIDINKDEIAKLNLQGAQPKSQ